MHSFFFQRDMVASQVWRELSDFCKERNRSVCLNNSDALTSLRNTSKLLPFPFQNLPQQSSFSGWLVLWNPLGTMRGMAHEKYPLNTRTM